MALKRAYYVLYVSFFFFFRFLLLSFAFLFFDSSFPPYSSDPSIDDTADAKLERRGREGGRGGIDRIFYGNIMSMPIGEILESTATVEIKNMK